MRKPKPLYPLPVDELFRHPLYIALPSAAVGMLLRLCEHFWKTGCRPLPRDDDQLFALARAHRPTWRHHRADVLRVFEDTRPALVAYREARENGAQGLRIAAYNTNAKRKARALEKAANRSTGLPTLPVTDHRLPDKAQPQTTNQPRSRMTDRRA
jgi:uncharacterized protein YdaU (DUF1376 family)